MPGFSSQEIIATAGASPFCARTATFNVRVSNSARDAVLATGRSSGGGTIFADRLASRGCDLVEGPRNKDRLETNASRLARLEFAAASGREHRPVCRQCGRPVPIEGRSRRRGDDACAGAQRREAKALHQAERSRVRLPIGATLRRSRAWLRPRCSSRRHRTPGRRRSRSVDDVCARATRPFHEPTQERRRGKPA